MEKDIDFYNVMISHLKIIKCAIELSKDIQTEKLKKVGDDDNIKLVEVQLELAVENIAYAIMELDCLLLNIRPDKQKIIDEITAANS